MEVMRDEFGFIDITELKPLTREFDHFWIEYNDKKYYFKKTKISENYNELIAEELAKDFKIPCAHYDLAIYNDSTGVISENILNEFDKYISIENILKEYFKDLEVVDKRNNLEDIWNAIDYKYNDPVLTKRLMDQLVNIFMFDSLIGNIDRHVDNYGIIENDLGVNFAPLFDNEKMLSSSIYDGGYSLGIDKDDYFFNEIDFEPDRNFLKKFFFVSSSEYIDYYKSKLHIISEENIDKVLKRVEIRTNSEITETLKKQIKDKFNKNRNMINNVLEQTKQRKLV